MRLFYPTVIKPWATETGPRPQVDTCPLTLQSSQKPAGVHGQCSLFCGQRGPELQTHPFSPWRLGRPPGPPGHTSLRSFCLSPRGCTARPITGMALPPKYPLCPPAPPLPLRDCWGAAVFTDFLVSSVTATSQLPQSRQHHLTNSSVSSRSKINRPFSSYCPKMNITLFNTSS